MTDKTRKIIGLDFSRRRLVRIGIIALVCVIIFGFLLIPCYIKGESMLPTYRSPGINFCNTIPMLYRAPKRGEVVMVKYQSRVLYLKRVIAFAGETLEIRDGIIYIDGKKLNESYVRKPSDWNLPPRKVKSGKLYVIGDNRSMDINEHIFGQVDEKSIIGVPLW